MQLIRADQRNNGRILNSCLEMWIHRLESRTKIVAMQRCGWKYGLAQRWKKSHGCAMDSMLMVYCNAFFIWNVCAWCSPAIRMAGDEEISVWWKRYLYCLWMLTQTLLPLSFPCLFQLPLIASQSQSPFRLTILFLTYFVSNSFSKWHLLHLVAGQH